MAYRYQSWNFLNVGIGYCTGPPGYIGWRNSFLGIDSGAPYTFKNTSSDIYSFTVFLYTTHPLPY
jgi:hypothetical protein